MKTVGISVGKENIGIVIMEKKRITFSKIYTLQKEDLGAKIGEILAQLDIEKGSYVYLTLPEKDVILRSFVLPWMSKREIESGISFEIEKYIPFKIEELIWDYSYRRFIKEKKILVSFLAIKKKQFEEIEGIISSQDLKLFLVEPRFFSLFRLIKNRKEYLKYKGLAIFDLTSLDCSFTFFFEVFALFNRSFSLKGLASKLDLSSEEIRTKVSEEIRFSLQYLRRHFAFLSLEKLAIVIKGISFNKEFFSSLGEDLEIDMDVIFLKELTTAQIEEVEKVEAYAATQVDSFRVNFIPVRKEKEGFLFTPIKAEKALFKFFLIQALVGIFFLVSMTIFHQMKVDKLTTYVEEKEKRIASSPFKGKSIMNLKRILKKYKESLKKIEKITPQKVSFLFEDIEKNIPKGMWLEDLKVNFEKGRVSISGYVYLNSYFNERRKITEFISRLSRLSKIGKLFPYVKVLRRERRNIQDFEVTYFEIGLRSEK
ncbi:MAG: hypothetical protein B6D55_08655 [Candidatus Omnitrophica bacterium 4484_70.2]|nr:MAG: hypothetical protein B6D55_08655 [Candidatus Omnitrophica bacterium 4484_70.2]